jgi:uncharacterized membrane protein
MTVIDQLLFPLACSAALGCGLIGGIFFAFSNFIMKALAQMPDDQGMRAMQGINVTVLNPLFLTIFLGTAVASVFLGLAAIFHWQRPGSILLLTGGVLYFVGNFVVTTAFNVPRNEALSGLEASDPRTVETWRTYVVEWSMWNHVRTITALIAAAAFTISVCQLRGA